MKKFTCLLIVILSGFLAAHAQSFSVSGNVTDESGIPLLGVNVLVKNQSRGTTTDFDGNYTIGNITSGDILQFSYLGFNTQEIRITDQQTLDVQLSADNEALDEVVVIGYGTQSKKEVTGAVSTVGSGTIEELNPVRVEQALQGRVAGVNITSTSGSPGSASTINIRGISTNGDSRPLILVDGAVIEDLSVINPNDIENISVLKDATAGIYGVRAANGVILITTKGGYKNTDLRIEVDAYTGLQETSRKLPVLNATEYAVILNEAFVAGGQNPPFPNYRNLGEGTDYQDEVFQQALMSDTNLSISGGGEKTAYSFGAGYLDQNGIVGGESSNFERFTGRMNFNYDIIKNLKLSTTAIYTHSNRKTLAENALGSVLFNAINMAPTIPVYDENGDFSLAELLGNEVINPVAQIQNTYNNSQVDKITGTAGLSYDFLEHFKAETRYQFNYSEVRGINFQPQAYYGSGKVFNVDRNVVSESTNFYRDYTFDAFLSYDNTFNDLHNVKALVGTSVFRTTGDFYGFTGYDIPGNSFENASIENASDVVDNYINVSNRIFDQRLLSYFARLQYNYDERYLLSGVIRRDGSSNFGPENKFGWFPSASAGWVISEEDFYGNGDLVSFLKLRSSYGILGNDRIGAFGYVSLLNGEGTYVFDDTLYYGVAAGRLSNPELQWEEQTAFDVGIDARLFGDKLDLTVDYFKRQTDKLLLTPQVSGILGVGAPGAGAPIVNAGSVENKGWEFSLGYRQIVNDDFDFNINWNLTTLENEVLSVANENGFVPGGFFAVGQGDAPARMEAGHPIGYFYGLQTDGIFQNAEEVAAGPSQPNAHPGDLRYVDQNGDGVITPDDRVEIGDPIPDYTMGLNLGFNYKNFDFTAYAFASVGNDIVRAYDRNETRTNKTSYVLNRWTGEGTSNTYPRVNIGANYNSVFSDFYVEDGSYLRLQNVQLGYSLGENITEQLGIRKLRFYLAVNNAFTITDYKGYDPSASSGAPIGGGIDQGFYPVPRVYTAGLNFKF
ncbi:SusC/RagA family TonB-linked outer membrane protein [Christiangramia flava]|uniref:TonB-dependent receptor n=1 Tax=Christiangramia flava JLT2011 TaxID=1229726 RepID=A0A1L7I3V2_9FLAO|nr:TonB-dependent receptor [Christiangramia flava]APU68290.1 TonB-dependent receptor [Christiangramia flava JLT2011]OSS40923.1 TonB-dependent receptor [Christiangramia flava JLT2011]